MADNRPPADVQDELPAAAQSAEDRKAASALASLDVSHDDATASKDVDRRAVDEAMKRLGAAAAASSSAVSASSKPVAAKPAVPVKNVKVEPADVALVVDQLDLARPKAMDLLRAHDGDAVEAMRAYVRA